MTTLSTRWTKQLHLQMHLPVAVGVAALFLSLGGIYWDVTWHSAIGRDSFWIPPHLLVYAGVSLMFITSLAGLALSVLRARSFGAALRTRGGLGFTVAALGPLIQMLAAPLDDLWHRRYGLDVTIWSPPHLMGIAGGVLGIVGLLIVILASTAPGRTLPLWKSFTAGEVLTLLLFAAGLTVSMFALGEFDFHLERRDVLLYALLAGTGTAFWLVAAARAIPRPGAALMVALLYTIVRSLVMLIVVGMGDDGSHVTPPVFALAPALAIELVLWRGLGGFAAALISGPAFVLGEWLYRALWGATAWELLQVLASLSFITLMVTAGGLAGDRLAVFLKGQGQP